MWSPLWRAGRAPLSNAERAALVMSAVRGPDGAAWQPGGSAPALVAPADGGPLRLVCGRVEVEADAFASRDLVPPGTPLRLAVSPERRSLLRRKRTLASRLPGQTADDVARCFGPAGDALGLQARWKSLRAPGWEEVRDVEVRCPVDGRALRWWTWSHPRAVRSHHRHIACCPACGQLDGLSRVLDAAARLHAELADPGPARYRVYVLDVLHPSAPGWYVGQTAKPLAERIEQHCNGRPGEAAKVFRNGGTVGPAQPAVLPALPELTTRQQALAAEQLVHRWLRLQSGQQVHGDGG